MSAVDSPAGFSVNTDLPAIIQVINTLYSGIQMVTLKKVVCNNFKPRFWQYCCVTGPMKNMQQDQGSNRGPSIYRVNALPTEIPDCLHIIHRVPVQTQVTPSTAIFLDLWKRRNDLLLLFLFKDLEDSKTNKKVQPYWFARTNIQIELSGYFPNCS